MFTSKLKVLHSHGIQYIRDLEAATLPPIFRGRPRIVPGMPAALAAELEAMCPTGAVVARPVRLDMGRCLFCGECARHAEGFIEFTSNYRMAANARDALIVREGDDPDASIFDPSLMRVETGAFFRRSLKLRQVSAGGDNACEMELNASGNVNFDFGRFGVDFVASPRHADGVVITGPITQNMALPLEICYNAIPDPKVVILAGSEAISGGLFAGSPAIDRRFLDGR
ncbi:MAG: NADH:ubiquinone oxidoreductase, partial [Rikenellaceae bacterium]|nr:NADH:ubiquinone oxidoreductase [Rikenellaceae bacterium]